MKIPKDPKALVFTVKETSEVLRVHRPKVYDLIKCGAIDAVKVGADWRIKRASLEKLVGSIPEDFFKKKD